MRVFAALPLPPEALRAVETALASLKVRYPRLRFVKPAGIHVTLHFFGEVPEEEAKRIAAIWGDRELLRAPIPASLGRLGQFPESGNPRVIWIGLDKGRQDLESYSAIFQSKIAALGYTEDPRGFSPHITVARNSGERLGRGWEVEVSHLDFSFQELVFFQSILTPGGSDYSSLARLAFRGGNDAGG